MFGHLEAPLLYQRAKLTNKPDVGLRRKCQISPRAHIRSDITQPELHNSPKRSINTISFPIITEILLGATQGSDTKILLSLLLLRHFQLDNTFSMIHGSDYAARSSPRSQRYNALISMRQLWKVTGISAWRSYNQTAWSEWLQGDHNVWIMQLYNFKISAPTKTAQAHINIPPFPLRRGFKPAH